MSIQAPTLLSQVGPYVIVTLFFLATFYVSFYRPAGAIGSFPSAFRPAGLSVGPGISSGKKNQVKAAFLVISSTAVVYLLSQFISAELLLVLPFAATTYVFVRYVVFPKVDQHAISIVITISLSIWWFFTKSWLAMDIVAVIAGVTFLAFLRNVTFAMVLVLCAVTLVWDVYATFDTGSMESFALHTGNIPSSVIFPKTVSSVMGGLGLGDFAVPGLGIMLAFREGKNRGLPLLWIGTLGGYLIGLWVAIWACETFRCSQPATLYLIPGVLVALLALAYNYEIAEMLLKGEGSNVTNQ